MYKPHPSPELNHLFVSRPFQGASPNQAKFLFVGLDANYGQDIHRSPLFPKLLEYHQDGVAFWHRNGVHHPFLLPQYSGDGQFYHRSFARIGFKPEHADLVSFIELLHVPTVGRNKLVPTDLTEAHLQRLNSAILDGNATHVFLPAGVVRLMRTSKAFPWLPHTSQPISGPLPILYGSGTKTVHSHLHFSVYGKFEQQKVSEAAAIRSLLLSDS